MNSKSRSINLFATSSDWQGLISNVEEKIEFYYVRSVELDGQIIRISSYLELGSLGFSHSGASSRDPAYLCIHGGADIEIRCVKQRDGEKIEFVDQVGNHDSITIKIGGQFESNVLTSGQIGTASDSEWSCRAFSVFQKEVRDRFEKVKSYYVGEEAFKLLQCGWRLTANARSAEAYDLSLT